MSKRHTLYRASVELHTEGRTLVGLAMPWDQPTRVVDPGKRPYLEALAPGSADVTMRQHPSFPVFVRHDYMTDPLGVVTFQRSGEGLLFTAPLSMTRDADDKLALVNDGAMGSVSLGFFPLKHTLRRFAAGDTVYRTEIGIRELSLAPTGFGQYPEARVLAVRDSLKTDQTFDAISDAVKDAIVAAIGASDDNADGPYVYVRDMSDSWCVYEVEGGPADLANARGTLYKVDYSQADDGTITVSDPVTVQVAYEPTEAAPTERANPHADLVARRMRADRELRAALVRHAVEA